MSGAPPALAECDSFPKLLRRNAAVRGARPAIREKDFGIWQTWTWAEVLDEVRALACGLAALGLRRGDKLAIIGDNRPQLYWSMVAAQAIGAVPVPMYHTTERMKSFIRSVASATARRALWRESQGRGCARPAPEGH